MIMMTGSIMAGSGMRQSIGAVEARRHLGELLERAYHLGEVFIVERAGRQMAALVPVEVYQQWQEQRQTFFARIDRVQRRTRRAPARELKADIAAAVKASRRSAD